MATGTVAALTTLVAASPRAGRVMVIVCPPDAAAEVFFSGVLVGSASDRCVVLVLEAGRDGTEARALGCFAAVFGVVTVHIRSWVRDFAPPSRHTLPASPWPCEPQEAVRINRAGGCVRAG